jgi:1,4-dihydroxy-2-naphthoyl-CoA hydrolase
MVAQLATSQAWLEVSARSTLPAMSIWQSKVTLEELQRLQRNTMIEHLDINRTEIGPDYLRATMPVDRRTVQTMGILHGGASVALAETVGSFAANLCVDAKTQACVGQEINANHLRPVASGLVTGTARPIHLGTRSQVWQIEIRDERDRMVCVSRLTLAIIDRPAAAIAGSWGKGES